MDSFGQVRIAHKVGPSIGKVENRAWLHIMRCLLIVARIYLYRDCGISLIDFQSEIV